MALAAKPLEEAAQAVIGIGCSGAAEEFDETKTFNFQCMPIRKFTIRLKSAQKAVRNVGKSFVWTYFGELCCNNILCDPRRYYCVLCLNKAKTDARLNATFEAFNIKKYQTNVSTSNYASHLAVAHGVQTAPRTSTTDRGAGKAAGSSSSRSKQGAATKQAHRRRHAQPASASAEADDQAAAVATLQSAEHHDQCDQAGQQQVVYGDQVGVVGQITLVEASSPVTSDKDIAACFVRDLIPLDVVGYSAFQEMLHKLGAVNDQGEVATVGRLKTGLWEMHSNLYRYVRDTLMQAATLGGCVTVSKWASAGRPRRYHFTSFSYHFVTEDFRFEHACLRIVTSLAPLAADNLAQELHRSLQHFQVDVQASKSGNKLFVVRDWSDAATADVCQQLGVTSYRCIGHVLNHLFIVNGLHNVLELRNLFNKCLLVISTLNLGAESLMMAIPEQFYEETLIEVGSLEDLLAAESLVDVPKTSSKLNDHDETPFSSRWHVTLTVLETFLKHRNVLDMLADQLQNVGDVVIDENEWRSLEAVHDFLATFADAVDILVGNCAASQYPTLNLALLFRSHLQLQLDAAKGDHPLIAHVKYCVRQSFAEQFPVDDCAILAALLDPRLRDLTVVNDYLAVVKKEKAQFLCEAVWKHAIVVTAVVPSAIEESPIVHQQVSVESQLSSSAKRAKLSIMELAKQYSGAVASSTDKCDAIGDEINSLLQLQPEAVVDDDILQFWNRKRENWPILATLARVIFAIPATSLRPFDLFYKDGLMRLSRRCSVSPTMVDKVIFVGENSCHFAK